MGHWGWRPLISALFISVWVTGCSITSDAALTLSPTMLPQVTLTLRNREPRASSTPRLSPPTATPTSDPAAEPEHTSQLYTLRPGDTLLGIALDYGIEVQHLRAANPEINPRALQVGQQIVIPPPGAMVALATPIMVILPPPTCYPMITGSILCLGRAFNQQPEPLSQVRVRVQLVDSDGHIHAERIGSVEQIVIPTGEAAPYGVIFHRAEYASVVATLESARPADELGDQWRVLVVGEATTKWDDNRYQVTAQVHNQTGQTLGPARITLTVFDEQDHIVGFRSVVMGEGFDVDEMRAIHLESILQGAQPPFSHSLHVEAPVNRP